MYSRWICVLATTEDNRCVAGTTRLQPHNTEDVFSQRSGDSLALGPRPAGGTDSIPPVEIKNKDTASQISRNEIEWVSKECPIIDVFDRQLSVVSLESIAWSPGCHALPLFILGCTVLEYHNHSMTPTMAFMVNLQARFLRGHVSKHCMQMYVGQCMPF